MPHARTLISASSSRGDGTGTSSTTSGRFLIGRGARKRQAFIAGQDSAILAAGRAGGAGGKVAGMVRMPRVWLWLIAAATLLSFDLGGMALLDPDEGRYAATSREMRQSGDPIIPRFNGEPRLNKPPLIHWLQAVSFGALGVTEWAARFPSLAAAIATLALVAWWARSRPRPSAAGSAVAALAGCLLFFACARLAIIDMTLTLGLTAALLAWHESTRARTPRARRALAWAAALSCGLAVLAKGPVGFLLPAAVIGATAVLARDGRMIAWRGATTAAAGIGLVTGPWLFCLVSRTGVHDVIDLLVRETYDRTIRGLDHPRPFYYFLLTGWVTLLPWSLAAPWLLSRSWKEFRAGGDDAGFLIVWFTVVLVFFSLPADKNDAYILPAAVPLALIVARGMRPTLVAGIAAATALALVICVAFASGPLSTARSLKQLCVGAELAARPDLVVIGYKLHRPSLVFYSGRRVRWVSTGSELRRVISAAPREATIAVVMEERRHERLSPGLASTMSEFGIAGVGSGCVALVRDGSGPSP